MSYNFNDIECPYCGHEYEINHDDGAFYREDVLEEDQCPECDKFFMVSTSVSYSHEGHKADCLNGSDHNWREWYTYWVGEKDEHMGEFYEERRCEDCEEKQHEWHKPRLGTNSPSRFDTVGDPSL